MRIVNDRGGRVFVLVREREKYMRNSWETREPSRMVLDGGGIGEWEGAENTSGVVGKPENKAG